MSYSDEIRFYLRIARRRFPYFLIPLVLVGIGGAIVVMKLPAIYSSSAKILVESQQIPTDFVKSTVTALASERLQVIQQRVLTRENILQIADKFKLFQSDSTLSRSDLVDLVRSRTTFEMLDLQTGPVNRRRRDENLTVVFAVGFDYERPDIATRVANELVTIVLNEDIQGRATRASETTNFINRENERLIGEIKSLDETIAQFKLKNSETLPEKLTYNMALLEKQQQQISNIERDLRSAADSKRLLEFEASVRATQVTSSPQGGQSLEQELSSLTGEYSRGLTVYSESHPNMRLLKKLIDAKRQALEQEKSAFANAKAVDITDPSLSVESRMLAEKIAAIDGQTKLLGDQREKLISSVSALQEVILVTPQIGAELAALERRRESLQRTIDQMSEKLSQAKLGERMEENQQAERFEVIEAPIVPQEPVRPKRLPLMMLVAAASVFTGAALAGGVEFLDGTVKRSADVTQKLNLRLLSVIPVIANRSDRRRRRLTISGTLLALALILLISLAAIHFLYQPLDLLSFRLMTFLNTLF